MPLIEHAGRTTIVMITPTGFMDSHPGPPGGHLMEHLARHGAFRPTLCPSMGNSSESHDVARRICDCCPPFRGEQSTPRVTKAAARRLDGRTDAIGHDILHVGLSRQHRWSGDWGHCCAPYLPRTGGYRVCGVHSGGRKCRRCRQCYRGHYHDNDVVGGCLAACATSGVHRRSRSFRSLRRDRLNCAAPLRSDRPV